MSGLLRVKLRRDLRASWSRLALMVIAIAISLTVFGGVVLARAVSTRETRDAYTSTEPASATLLLDEPVGTQQMAGVVEEVRSVPGVTAATGRTQFSSEVAVNGLPRGLPLQLFVATPDDPMAMVRFEITGGAWPPSPDEIFIARDALAVLGISIGDTVGIETPSGEPVELTVAGTVYDPSLSPAAQEQTGRAYVSTEALAPPGEAELDQLKIQVTEPGEATPTGDRDAIIAVARQVGQWLSSEYGLSVREIQVPPPYEHPHQWQVDSLLVALLAGGLAALLLSTILVANMLSNLFSRQIPQIGIMKAIGARSGRIAGQYVTMTIVVAVAATALAIPAATSIGRAAAGYFLAIVGVEPASLAAPWWGYAVIVGVGLGLPPLMALVPLIRTSRTTVRAAIDHHGAGAKPGAVTGVIARLSRLRGIDRGLLMALRNTVRRPARFLLAIVLLASAGTVFVAGMSLGSSVNAVSEEQKEQRNWDVDVQLVSPATSDEIAAVVEAVPGVARVEGLDNVASGLAGPGQIPVTRTYPDQGHGGTVVTAIPDNATLFSTPTLVEGRWLQPGETGAIVLNQVARKNTLPGTRTGDTVELSLGGTRTTWQVVGIVEERGGRATTYATADGLAEATGRPAQVSQLRIATDTADEQTRTSVAAAVDDALTDAGIDVKSADSVSRSDAITEGHMGPIVSIVLAIAIAMGVVGGIGLASMMSSNVLDRIREFAVMHAIGARPKVVRRIVVAEGVFLALTSVLAAVVPALVLTKILGAGLGDLFFSAALPFRVSLLAVGVWFALVLLGAVLATDAAASRASRITVREALAHG